MCWNQAVSLNTFLFSSFVLGMVIYNNSYTQYKIEVLNNIWVYLFIFSVISMQLAEFFIWRNINNSFYNRVFTWVADILLVLQPALSLMLIPDVKLKTTLLSIYSILAISFTIHQIFTFDLNTTVSKCGHLSWNTSNLNLPFRWLIWLFFFGFSFVYLNIFLGAFVCFLLLFIAYYNYKNDQSVGSMWCWLVNGFAIYYAFYLLFYLPFAQKTGFARVQKTKI